MEKLLDALRKRGFHIARTEEWLRLDKGDMCLSGKSSNTIWTASGVFVEECYAFAAEGDFVVFDIGMNIGAASIYFAQYANVRHIYAFEPFAPTYALALRNFAANPLFEGKITPFNFGLGLEDGFTVMHYCEEFPGAMSSVKDRFADNEQAELARIEIRSAAGVLGPLFERHMEKIFLKIDCEGAEKDILVSLARADLLKKVSAIAMEWHDTPPAYITKLLARHDFFVFFRHDIPDKLGMIHAVNRVAQACLAPGQN